MVPVSDYYGQFPRRASVTQEADPELCWIEWRPYYYTPLGYRNPLRRGPRRVTTPIAS